MVRLLTCCAAIAAASLLAGCGHKAKLNGLVKVAGTVTYEGQPIEGANVIFGPEGEGRSASGMTDANGRFQLTTLEPNDGAMLGKYKVAVSKIEVENPMSADEAREWFVAHGGPPEPGNIKNRLPEKYKDTEGSGLGAEVLAGGNNDFTFELK